MGPTNPIAKFWFVVTLWSLCIITKLHLLR